MKTVLIVEDDELIGYFFEECLKGECQTRRAKTMAEAMRADCADLVILDLKLPNSQGSNTIKAARDKFKWQPILVVTGGTDLTYDDVLEAGATAVMDKESLLPHILLAAVKGMLLDEDFRAAADTHVVSKTSTLISVPSDRTNNEDKP